jgi:hypothetical protein
VTQREGRESEARNGADTDGQAANRQPIPLNFIPRRTTGTLEPLCLAAIAGLLAITCAQGAVGGRPVSWLGQNFRNDQAPIAALPTFPANGATFMTVRPDPAVTVPLTVQTPAGDGGVSYVATLRDWATNRLIAAIFLGADSATTVSFPAGTYRLSVASGHTWHNERTLFGWSTRAVRAIVSIVLTWSAGKPVGHVIHLTVALDASYETISDQGFLDRQ